MHKTSKKTRFAIDKTSNLVYNTDMKRNNNTNESNKMKFTKYNTNVNHLTTHEMVASKIEKGLTNELTTLGDIEEDLTKVAKQKRNQAISEC